MDIICVDVTGISLFNCFLPVMSVSDTLVVAAQPETANTVENQPVDEPQTSRFTWTIENFSRLNTKKHYSEAFVVGGFKW